MNALTPTTPQAASSRSRSASSSTRPPQSAKSTIARSDAISYFTSNASASSVGGIEFSGMSAIVVVPPAAAPRVAASQPSQSARPGSFTWTCASTTPGRTTRPRASISSRASPLPGATRPVIVRSRIMTSASTTPSAVTTRPPRTARSGKLYREILRAFVQRETAELRETLVALDHRREMIPGELADLAREAHRAVREQDLHLADAAGVHEDLPRRGVARVVLEVDAEAILTHRDPGGFAAPAHVHELAADREAFADGGARLRRELLLEPRLERV